MRSGRTFQSRTDGRVHTYYADTNGFRRGAVRDSGQARLLVVLVGESFTFGTGVDYEATYGARLESMMPGVKVRNLAMPGFGIDQMWVSVRYQALPLRPDLLVVAFVDHDFERSLTSFRAIEGFNKPTFVLRHGRLRPKTRDDGPGDAVLALERHSQLWTLGRLGARRLAELRPFGEWWYLNAAILDQIRADCAAHGTALLFVRLPTMRRVAFRTLGTHLREAGVDYLDLADPRLPWRPEMFIVGDGHLSEAGHGHVARALAEWLGTRLRATGMP